MEPKHYLAVHDLPGDLEDALQRVARNAHHRGARPLETYYSRARDRGYTYFSAADERAVEEILALSGVGVVDVFPTERIATDLMDAQHRGRVTE